MNPMILACLTAVTAMLGVTAVVMRNRRARNGK